MPLSQNPRTSPEEWVVVAIVLFAICLLIGSIIG